MQYLYILTSTSKDNYYEQFLLSATSLKLLMPNANVILLCDSKTKSTLTEKRSEYLKYVSQTITADVPEGLSQIEVSRWIKTSMRKFITGDFLFIDCDTIITNDLSAIENLGIKFGACLDKHSLIDSHGKGKSIIENDKKLNFSSYTSNRHINSGIIFCSDCPQTHKLFSRWHELWLYSKSKNILRDQPSFNMAILENSEIFSELDGVWNCQISYNGLPYLSNSKIIHYFATDIFFNESPFLLAGENIYKHIKETGVISDDAINLIKNARSSFNTKSRIITGNDMLDVINSNLFQFIYFLRKNIPSVFNVLNKIFSIFKKSAKNVIINSKNKNNSNIKHYN